MGKSIGNKIFCGWPHLKVAWHPYQTILLRLDRINGYCLTDVNIKQVIQDMTAYATNNSISLNDVKNDADLLAIVNGAWHT